ncbi:MAG TPA: serine hydrolase domain-containing protein [Thermoanaerobaculia bacterium]|nr:serine hydrolase domain-containing protein [Thermoanaerobaculia bacterium]
MRSLERFLRLVVIGRFGYTAAAARVERRGRRVAEAVAGAASGETRFDLASLTKPVVATLATRLESAGRLDLATPIGDVLGQAHPGLAARSLEDLLRHRSGLRPWAPLYALAGSGSRSADPRDALLRDPRWSGARRGTYSDLGYLVLGRVLERALSTPLAAAVEVWVSAPLIAGAGASGFLVQPGPRSGAAACALDTGREVQLAAALGLTVSPLGAPPRGRAQDGNARVLGGLPGHAGLFADLATVAALGRAWLGVGDRRARLLAPADRRRALAGGGGSARGWRRRRLRGSAGPALSASAFGHDGFAGGSLWIDPQRELVLTLLGHRTDPFMDLRPLRRAFHRLGVRLVGA